MITGFTVKNTVLMLYLPTWNRTCLHHLPSLGIDSENMKWMASLIDIWGSFQILEFPIDLVSFISLLRTLFHERHIYNLRDGPMACSADYPGGAEKPWIPARPFSREDLLLAETLSLEQRTLTHHTGLHHPKILRNMFPQWKHKSLWLGKHGVT